jgi:dimethylamine/trimethylamine dehydrogenase
MARDPKYDILFEPVRIGSKTMRNRFYQTPHCTGFGSDLPGTQAYHRSIKAEGGWAVVNTEWCSIHPESDEKPAGGARIWDDTDVRNLSLTCDRVHEHGSLAGIELGFNAQHITNYESRRAARGVSQLASETFFSSCYAMTKKEIRELQSFYVAAARRARSAGFDIVNIMGSETACVPQLFLMPLFNKRTDEYGGSFENRARFWLETLELVREAVGHECAITTRFCIDTLHGSGAGIRAQVEGAAFIRAADHLVDFWDLQVGGPTMAEWGEDAGPSRFFRENAQTPFVAHVRPHTRKPIVGVGRFTSPDTMVDVIRSGTLDIIGAARPSISDPFLPRKIEEGRLDEIRECIGCNICISRHEQATTIVCTQNATVGEEYRRGWHPERFDRALSADRDVLVVGAGPAGLECAVVLGRRGFRRVHLVDARPEPGGCVNWIARLPGLGEWRRLVSWRSSQLERLRNVELIVETRLVADDVMEYGAELVVVATGSRWSRDGLGPASHGPIPGAALPHVFTPEQIMVEGARVSGGRVLVYDCDGYYMAASLAEKLARDGYTVRLVTFRDTVVPYMHFTLESHRMLGLLKSLGVELVTHHWISEITESAVVGHDAYATDEVVEWEADGVVLVTQRISDDQLFRELVEREEETARAGIEGVFRIGDCVVPRILAEVIFDGHRLGREIDSDDPAVPLPYIRERRVLEASDADYDGILPDRGAGSFRPTSARAPDRATPGSGARFEPSA